MISGFRNVFIHAMQSAEREHEMSINRIFMAVVLGMILCANTGLVITPGFIGLLVSIFISILIFLHLVFYPDFKHSRRITALVMDILSLSYQIHVNAAIGSFLYPLYLWIAFGNGFRFGERYLLLAILLNLLAFTTVIALTSFWHGIPWLAMGLALGLMIIPLYSIRLIRSLSDAKKAAERDALDKSNLYREVAVLNTLLEARANKDGLTGLANRRCFDEFLEEHWYVSSEKGIPISIVLLDVDHFKRFNDRFGHPAGDDCLRFVAKILVHHTRREGELAARYGGEEFALIFVGIPGPIAVQRAEEIRIQIAALSIPITTDESTNVTVSIGVSCGLPNLYAKDGIKMLIHAADSALYAAKDAGRNHVCYDVGSKSTQRV